MPNRDPTISAITRRRWFELRVRRRAEIRIVSGTVVFFEDGNFGLEPRLLAAGARAVRFCARSRIRDRRGKRALRSPPGGRGGMESQAIDADLPGTRHSLCRRRVILTRRTKICPGFHRL